jgi:hypothetical protein
LGEWEGGPRCDEELKKNKNKEVSAVIRPLQLLLQRSGELFFPLRK